MPATDDMMPETVEHPPHIHRLLRLIREGTPSHASRASALLGRYAASCITGVATTPAGGADEDDNNNNSSSSLVINSSLILWDLIGRLVGGDKSTDQQCSRRNKDAIHYQSGLFDAQTQTRVNCAMALESVARCLPLEDRRHFFEGEEWHCYDEDGSNHGVDATSSQVEECRINNLWLNVNDLHRVHHGQEGGLSTSKNQLDVIVERGRLLLSSSGEQYNWNCDDGELKEYILENEALQNLDTTAATWENDDNERRIENKNPMQLQKSFLQKRVALQRQILSRRLGLGGILSASIMNANDDNDALSSSSLPNQKPLKRRRIVDDIVADEDLLAPATAEQIHTKSTNGNNNDNNKINQYPLGIRALLVLESKRSSKNTPMGGSKHGKHRNPQTLLGSELAYRSFDSEWTVRHGSLLGTLALLRAWRIRDPSTSSISQQQSFGKWPHDILARCVCILALDQFSDYSGVDLTTAHKYKNDIKINSTDDVVSNTVVAPVREMAAQIIAILLEAAPLDVWSYTHDLLMQLYDRKYQHRNRQERGSQWEITHGVLLTWKYVIAITLFQTSQKQPRSITNLERESPILRPLSARSPQDNHDKMIKVFNLIIPHAISEISDGNDDNRAVSAQVLRFCMRLDSKLHVVDIVKRCSGPLWTAVTKIGDISSCAAELLSLLGEILSRDCASFLSSLRETDPSFAFDSLLHKLSKFIDHGSAHVSISTFNALSSIVEPITKASSHNDYQKTGNINSAMDELLNRIFETYFTNLTGWSDEIGKVRDQAWLKILDALPSLVTQQNSMGESSPLSTSFVSLTLQYFRASRDHLGRSVILSSDSISANTISQENTFDSYRKASHALASFYEKACSASQIYSANLPSIAATVIEAMIQSPWIDQCEAACLLQVAMSSKMIWNRENCETASLIECQQHLTSYLTISPISILLKERSEASLLLDDCNYRFRCGRHFATALHKMVQEKNPVSSDDIVRAWEAQFLENGVSFQELRELPKAAITQTSMRLSASIAGAVTCCCCRYLPRKITPLIRTVLTSLKNEQSYPRRLATCHYIAELVIILSDNESYSKAMTKLLENVCIIACDEGLEKSNSSQGGASLVIELLIENIGENKRLQDFHPIWKRLSQLRDISRLQAASPERSLADSVFLLCVVSRAITAHSSSFADILIFSLSSIVAVACFNSSETIRTHAVSSINNFCSANLNRTMDVIIPSLLPIISDLQDDAGRKGGCELLFSVLRECGVSAAQYVPQLLPVSMRLMTDAMRECSMLAASIFAILVRLAPLAASDIVNRKDEKGWVSDRVITHLILGEPMPPCALPEIVSTQLKESGTVLRPYQVEGVSWLKFLHDVKLNGALCDDMGLGKTLQALVAVAISHSGLHVSNSKHSLVVCPASVVGHWVNEIDKFFPGGDVLIPIAYTGTVKERRAAWSGCLTRCNIIVTSYSVLRTDVDLLENVLWDYCILDEGHLLKNPKTATAKASRRLKARHRLILTGTIVQNNVNEVWATFDFLMPNFLGTEASYSKEFARPIIKSQAPDACAYDIDQGLDSLKILHQQVLPFILRREKMQVMNELPPKTVTDVPCQLSREQRLMYQDILKVSGTKDALEHVANELLEEVDQPANGTGQKICSDVLKSLLQLRLICTHPLLHKASRKSESFCSFARLDCSGKLVALNDLLRHSGIVESEIAAADNDDTSFLLPDDNAECDFDMMGESQTDLCGGNIRRSTSKCLIFAQFTQSLDIVEQYLFEPHMPSLQYLRLDGRVPTNNRQSIVDRFNSDENIKVLLLTTKVGGLGLNLTGAETVIFLEPDWNPSVDVQAQDRAHRIGQTKAVNIYRLITSNTIEEKMMGLQQRKKAISDAVVNSENSTMYSMGTDKLLDIFTFRGSLPKSGTDDDDDNLLSYLDEDTSEYANLSVGAFLGGLS